MLYHNAEIGKNTTVVCDLCHHRCTILDGALGACKARRNDHGTLVSLVYGHAIALNPDPIEKKPFFHFLPGTSSMSTATVGCNFICDFCQNHHISQHLREKPGTVPGEHVSPAEIVRAAITHECKSIACTYTEPTIYFEYALEIAQLAQKSDIATCFVSNGFMTPKAVKTIAPFLDAINVDLKCFSEKTYRKTIGGNLKGVLETLGALHEQGIWIEVTTLLIEGLNDSDKEVRDIAKFIAGLNPDIPWHVSRFHPTYHRLTTPATDSEAILRALDIGREAGLHHIYCGNMRDNCHESTWCAGCGELLIERRSYQIVTNLLGTAGICPKCAHPCAGVWA